MKVIANSYPEFISQKKSLVRASGFDVKDSDINPMLFDWQRHVVKWALQRGKAALFEECGLGKTFQQVEWARLVSEHTGQKVLILAPLAVAHQTVEEAHKLNVGAKYCRTQESVDKSQERIIVVNYDMLKAIDTSVFSGVVLDESSILKSFSGSTRNQLIGAFQNTPYKLACTATPAPNDNTELGNHAEFLDAMKREEMLAMYFKHDGGDTSVWRVKRHGEKDFWKWVTEWAVCASKPSDLGYSDEGYELPPLYLHDHVVSVDHTRAFAQGQLFVDGAVSATAMWKERGFTNESRCAKAVELVDLAADKPFIVWCDTNDEADILKRQIKNAVEVRGSDSVQKKESGLTAFTDGATKRIITKPDVAGWGLNWQHCSDMAFVGVTYSFEKMYQSLRRSYRFGQKNPVHAHMIYAESEGGIRQAIQVKQKQHHETQQKANEAMKENGMVSVPVKKIVQPRASNISMPAWI